MPVIFGAKIEVGEARINCKHGGCPCESKKEEISESKYISEDESFRGMIG